MTKISSGMTFFMKRVFPAIWFGFLALFATGAVQDGPMFLIIPIIMAVFGYFMMKKMVWVLADEVYDCEDFLLVKNGGTEERIYLSSVMNVSASTFYNPPQITLRLITSTVRPTTGTKRRPKRKQ